MQPESSSSSSAMLADAKKSFNDFLSKSEQFLSEGHVIFGGTSSTLPYSKIIEINILARSLCNFILDENNQTTKKESLLEITRNVPPKRLETLRKGVNMICLVGDLDLTAAFTKCINVLLEANEEQIPVVPSTLVEETLPNAAPSPRISPIQTATVPKQPQTHPEDALSPEIQTSENLSESQEFELVEAAPASSSPSNLNDATTPPENMQSLLLSPEAVDTDSKGGDDTVAGQRISSSGTTVNAIEDVSKVDGNGTTGEKSSTTSSNLIEEVSPTAAASSQAATPIQTSSVAASDPSPLAQPVTPNLTQENNESSDVPQNSISTESSSPPNLKLSITPPANVQLSPRSPQLMRNGSDGGEHTVRGISDRLSFLEPQVEKPVPLLSAHVPSQSPPTTQRTLEKGAVLEDDDDMSESLESADRTTMSSLSSKSKRVQSPLDMPSAATSPIVTSLSRKRRVSGGEGQKDSTSGAPLPSSSSPKHSKFPHTFKNIGDAKTGLLDSLSIDHGLSSPPSLMSPTGNVETKPGVPSSPLSPMVEEVPSEKKKLKIKSIEGVKISRDTVQALLSMKSPTEIPPSTPSPNLPIPPETQTRPVSNKHEDKPHDKGSTSQWTSSSANMSKHSEKRTSSIASADRHAGVKVHVEKRTNSARVDRHADGDRHSHGHGYHRSSKVSSKMSQYGASTHSTAGSSSSREQVKRCSTPVQKNMKKIKVEEEDPEYETRYGGTETHSLLPTTRSQSSALKYNTGKVKKSKSYPSSSKKAPKEEHQKEEKEVESVAAPADQTYSDYCPHWSGCKYAQQTADPMMNWVECERCARWFHTFCVFSTNREHPESDNFVCYGRNKKSCTRKSANTGSQ